jgi:hypothetical protein
VENACFTWLRSAVHACLLRRSYTHAPRSRAARAWVTAAMTAL